MKNVEISYENSKGETVSFKALDSWTFCGGDIFGFTASQTTLNNKIIGFGEVVTDYTLSCAFLNCDNAEYRNKLVDVISVDLESESKGKLIYGENYRPGWITSIKFGEYTTERACPFTLGFSADSPYWFRQKEVKIKHESVDKTGLDYPHDYLHDYSIDNSSFGVVNQDITENALLNILFTRNSGTSTSCSITLSNNVWQNEYLVNTTIDNTLSVEVVNAQNKAIIKRKFGKPDVSIFSSGSRESGKDCFARLPRGEYLAVLPSGLEARLTLIERRYLPWMD